MTLWVRALKPHFGGGGAIKRGVFTAMDHKTAAVLCKAGRLRNLYFIFIFKKIN